MVDDVIRAFTASQGFLSARRNNSRGGCGRGGTVLCVTLTDTAHCVQIHRPVKYGIICKSKCLVMFVMILCQVIVLFRAYCSVKPVAGRG